MPCNRDFGVIMKRKKISKCIVSKEMQHIVRRARLKNPFNVVAMEKKK